MVKGNGGGAASTKAKVTCLLAWRASLHWPLTPPPENLILSWMHHHLLHVPRLHQAWRLLTFYESHRHPDCCAFNYRAKRARTWPWNAMAIAFFACRPTQAGLCLALHWHSREAGVALEGRTFLEPGVHTHRSSSFVNLMPQDQKIFAGRFIPSLPSSKRSCSSNSMCAQQPPLAQAEVLTRLQLQAAE